jgi:dolichol-phosphate mannosyltransferase
MTMSRSSLPPLPPNAVLSIVIPAHDEAANLGPTVDELVVALDAEGIPFELIIVNDHSRDGTLEVARELAAARSELRVLDSRRAPGFGRAIRAGLAEFRGDAVVIVMADRSDDPADVVRYYRKLEAGCDCVFGSRFRRGSTLSKYPRRKLIANRLVNKALQLLFWTNFNDLTNAFKAFRREVILECGPYTSCHFNLTVEMSLSALIRRYHIEEIPIAWYGRTWGASKLSLALMGRRYLSVVLKLFFERILISDDLIEDRLSSGGLDESIDAQRRVDESPAQDPQEPR